MKKINNLSSSFRKELKKVLMAKKSGMSSEDLCPEIVVLERFVVPGRRRRCLAGGFKSCLSVIQR
jgi:hypothetical protein